MSEPICFAPNCRERSSYICKCSDSESFCQNHIYNHINSWGNHLASFKINAYISDCRFQLSNDLSQLMSRTKKSILEIITCSQEAIKNISSDTKKLLQSFYSIKSKISEIIKYYNNLILIDKAAYDSGHIEIQDISRLICNCNQDSAKFIEKVSSIDSIENHKRDDGYAVVFSKIQPNQINLLNLETLSLEGLKLNSNEIGNQCGCCKISDSKYFVYGGYGIYKDTQINSAYIIDIKRHKVKQLLHDKPICAAGLCLYNQNVYCFGGFGGGSLMKNSKKFDLIENRWINICSLPQAGSRVTAVYSNSLILIASYHIAGILGYNPNQNTYLSRIDYFAENRDKYIFENWIVCFGDYLYEINEDHNLIKRSPLKGSCNGINSCCSFKRGASIYFLTSSYDLYSIRTDSKTVDFIMKV